MTNNTTLCLFSDQKTLFRHIGQDYIIFNIERMRKDIANSQFLMVLQTMLQHVNSSNTLFCQPFEAFPNTNRAIHVLPLEHIKNNFSIFLIQTSMEAWHNAFDIRVVGKNIKKYNSEGIIKFLKHFAISTISNSARAIKKKPNNLRGRWMTGFMATRHAGIVFFFNKVGWNKHC